MINMIPFGFNCWKIIEPPCTFIQIFQSHNLLQTGFPIDSNLVAEHAPSIIGSIDIEYLCHILAAIAFVFQRECTQCTHLAFGQLYRLNQFKQRH